MLVDNVNGNVFNWRPIDGDPQRLLGGSCRRCDNSALRGSIVVDDGERQIVGGQRRSVSAPVSNTRSVLSDGQGRSIMHSASAVAES